MITRECDLCTAIITGRHPRASLDLASIPTTDADWWAAYDWPLDVCIECVRKVLAMRVPS